MIIDYIFTDMTVTLGNLCPKLKTVVEFIGGRQMSVTTPEYDRQIKLKDISESLALKIDNVYRYFAHSSNFLDRLVTMDETLASKTSC